MIGDLLNRLGWPEDVVRRAVYAACNDMFIHDKDDIVQQVSAIITERLRSPDPPRFETEVQLQNYTFTIAHNLRKAFWEQRQKQVQLFADIAAGRPPRSTDEESRLELIRKLSDGQREAILNLLPEDKRRLRDVVRLRLQGLNYAEIGKLLGMSQPTVGRRLGAALEYVKLGISDVVNHPSAAPAPGAGQ